MTKLLMTPYVYSKLLYIRDIGDTEIGGFGVCENEEYPLLITDFQMVKQECTSATVEFDDDDIYRYVDEMAKVKIYPAQCMRIWIHTHPGSSPNPSNTDENTFKNKILQAESKHPADWGVMYILAKEGAEYARLSVYAGEQSKVFKDMFGLTSNFVSRKIENVIDYDESYNGTDYEAWEKEYEMYVSKGVSYYVAPGLGIPEHYKSDNQKKGSKFSWPFREEHKGAVVIENPSREIPDQHKVVRCSACKIDDKPDCQVCIKESNLVVSTDNIKCAICESKLEEHEEDICDGCLLNYDVDFIRAKINMAKDYGVDVDDIDRLLNSGDKDQAYAELYEYLDESVETGD